MNDIMEVLVTLLVFGTIIAIPLSFLWFDHRTRKRGLDTLRIYAERGEEPPASVIEGVTRVTNPWGNPQPLNIRLAPRPQQTRANHLAHAAASTIIAIGVAGIVWWRVSAYGENGTGIVVGCLVALFFAGSVAARLVYAYYASEK